MNTFERRRFWVLWMPTTLASTVVQFVSYGLSVTANGLTLVGLALISVGIVCAALDAGSTR